MRTMKSLGWVILALSAFAPLASASDVDNWRRENEIREQQARQDRELREQERRQRDLEERYRQLERQQQRDRYEYNRGRKSCAPLCL